MISFVKGKILKNSISKDSYVDLLTDSGVGYRIAIPNTYILPAKGEEYSLFTHLYVREDTQSLYGFSTEDERDFFEQLIGISGIGPKIGITILSAFSRSELESIIEEGDARSLSKVPGLGMKRAQKIIIELRGIIDLAKKSDEENSSLKDLREALRSLGFSTDTIKEKVSLAEKILQKEKDIDIGELIKRVIKE